MMKLLIFFLLTLSISSGYSQRASYDKGTMMVQAGAGIFSTIYSSSHSPSYHISIERGIAELGPGIIGVGIVGNYQTSSFNYYGGGILIPSNYLTYDFKNLTLDLKGSYYPKILNTKVFDIYGSVLIGANVLNSSITPVNGGLASIPNLGPASGLHMGILAGVRAYIGPKIGIWIEGGYDISPLKAGLVAKF